jgi:hypothetical protein
MEKVTLLRVVVASPGDVQAERDLLSFVIDELNRGVARSRGFRLEVIRWEKDAYPGFHADGPQGLIDPILRIEDADLFVGIFWKRFGTPTMGSQSGTEHEFLRAYEAWSENGSPHIMFYFNQKPHTPTSVEEAEQLTQVLNFQRRFPREGLWWGYGSELEFERLVREHLTKFVLEKEQEEENDEEEEEDDTEQDSIHFSDSPLGANEHARLPCSLEEGDKIRISLSSDRPLDVMIFDEGDYQSWMKTGEVDTFYGNYPGEDHGNNFNGFFTAPEDGEYLVIVCNRSRREVDMRLDISYAN